MREHKPKCIFYSTDIPVYVVGHEDEGVADIERVDPNTNTLHLKRPIAGKTAWDVGATRPDPKVIRVIMEDARLKFARAQSVARLAVAGSNGDSDDLDWLVQLITEAKDAKAEYELAFKNHGWVYDLPPSAPST